MISSLWPQYKFPHKLNTSWWDNKWKEVPIESEAHHIALFCSFQSGWDPLETEAVETSVSCGPHFLEQKARESCSNVSHSHQVATEVFFMLPPEQLLVFLSLGWF